MSASRIDREMVLRVVKDLGIAVTAIGLGVLFGLLLALFALRHV